MVTWWIISLIAWPIFGMMRLPSPYIALAVVAVISGLAAAALHYFFLKEWLPIGLWWIAVGALSWLSLGIIPGIVLTIILSKEAVPMEGRWFEPSESAQA
jgi:hypothetical protein